MKNLVYVFISVLIILFLGGCSGNTGKNKPTAQDLMTIRSLGLAYLEEFKFQEAADEFKKFTEIVPDDKFGYANLGLTFLRMGNYEEAGKQLFKAKQLAPDDPDILLILATVYKMSDEHDKAVAELKKALEVAPSHVKVLYELSEIYSTENDTASLRMRKGYLQKLIISAPQNLVPKLNLTAILINDHEFDSALEQMEIIRKQFPEFPKEAVEFYNKTISSIRKKDEKNATLNFTIFHNYLKVTAPYQASMIDLKGPGGSNIGFPLITFDSKGMSALPQNGSILNLIKITEVSESAGLNNEHQNAKTVENNKFSHIESIDFDMDGDIDIYAGYYDPETKSFRHFLFSNNSGKFTDITTTAGLSHTGIEKSAAFGDYDNDGFPDLFIIRPDGDILYRNKGNGTFEDVTASAHLGSKNGSMALFFDADHDGDLDLFEGTSGKNLLFRNNSDGTFTEQAEKMNLSGQKGATTDAAFGDFDDDGDIDLFVAGTETCSLMSNQRQSLYKDITEESGIVTEGRSDIVSVSDYNNDGFQDILVLSEDGNNAIFRNLENGKFEKDKSAAGILKILNEVKISDAAFLDFDNDGFSDIFIAGEKVSGDQRGIYLFHNEGKGGFTNVSELLPSGFNAGRKFTIFDYNSDGDPDIAFVRPDGGIALLRNDGGNNNHYVKMKLVGLRAGSAKNNYFGIGAKVEIRAGDLYQSMVVTEPEFQFGLGERQSADVIRITWSNGVPQNVLLPAANQALIEAQTLKGSCPFLYAWNGSEYEFVKDILWRSGLGMPLGIMGGNTAYAFADASDDYLKIPGEKLQMKDGMYSIQVTSELWETIYLDKLQLVAADHPDTTDVFIEEQFSPPPFPGMKLFHVDRKIRPVSAIDDQGNDVLSLIISHDYKFLSDFQNDNYQGITGMHDLVLDPGNVKGNNLILYLTGWIFPTDASINVALSQSGKTKVAPPSVQVMNRKGEWETVIGNISFPMGKDKTVIADLSGKFLTGDHRIRIRTNMEIYWDEIFFSEGLSNAPVITTEMEPSSADLHYRGFSAMYRKGERYGPHWFDYSKVTKETKWRDLTGNYTRYGEVRPLLASSDNKYIIYNAGDEATVSFSPKNLPELKKAGNATFLSGAWAG
jgi:Tfp pilus assembly protein PilF